jgi:hypothetical protein
MTHGCPIAAGVLLRLEHAHRSTVENHEAAFRKYGIEGAIADASTIIEIRSPLNQIEISGGGVGG